MKRGLLLLACVAGLCATAKGGLIAGYYFEKSVRPEDTPYPVDGSFQFFYGPYINGWPVDGMMNPPPWGPVVDVSFTYGDSGTWTTNTGEAFDVAVASMTNGEEDSMSWLVSFFEGIGGPEVSLWTENNVEPGAHSITSYYAGSNGIDLQGFQIESISFRLDAYGPYYIAFAIEVYGAPPVMTVAVDVKPGTSPNTININGNGVIPVAILGSSDLDISQVDVSTLTFASLPVRVKPNGMPQCSIDDVSGPAGVPDGYNDLVCQFMDDAELWTPGDGTATLEGKLKDGTPISGSDEISVVP